MANDKKKIVIVKKKKVAGGGHHGGSWKVAYADFVTAMMAFFMVMWILGMDENMRKAIEGYFANPVGYKKGYSSGASPLASGASPAQVHAQQQLRLIVKNFETKTFSRIGEKVKMRIEKAKSGLKLNAQVEVVMTKDGLRIELIEDRTGETFFPVGSAVMKPAAALALELIAQELMSVRNPLIVEGHTDAAPFGAVAGYSNWELSADRANAARRVLEASGIDPKRIVEVRGLADRHLRVPSNALSPSNRRISILLPFTSFPDPIEPGVPAAGMPAGS
jgi:chemotaxis protein MotB